MDLPPFNPHLFGSQCIYGSSRYLDSKLSLTTNSAPWTVVFTVSVSGNKFEGNTNIPMRQMGKLRFWAFHVCRITLFQMAVQLPAGCVMLGNSDNLKLSPLVCKLGRITGELATCSRAAWRCLSCVTWELFRNAYSRLPPQNQNLRECVQQSVFLRALQVILKLSAAGEPVVERLKEQILPSDSMCLNPGKTLLFSCVIRQLILQMFNPSSLM